MQFCLCLCSLLHPHCRFFFFFLFLASWRSWQEPSQSYMFCSAFFAICSASFAIFFHFTDTLRASVESSMFVWFLSIANEREIFVASSSLKHVWWLQTFLQGAQHVSLRQITSGCFHTNHNSTSQTIGLRNVVISPAPDQWDQKTGGHKNLEAMLKKSRVSSEMIIFGAIIYSLRCCQHSIK